jgi:hypothetical protein
MEFLESRTLLHIVYVCLGIEAQIFQAGHLSSQALLIQLVLSIEIPF